MPELKRIETHEQKQKREKKKTIIGIIIGIILVASSIAFTLMQGYETTKEQKYKDYVFVKQNNLWQTKIDSKVLQTEFLPQEVENVTAKNLLIPQLAFSGKTVYFIAKSSFEKEAASMIAQHLNAKRMQFACLPGDNSTECSELPERNCENLSQDSALVIIRDTTQTSNETSLDYTTSCLTIKGNDETLVKAAEKAIFIIYGVIS